MSKTKIALGSIVALYLSLTVSCGPENQDPPSLLYETQYWGVGTYMWCCRVPGNSCYRSDQGIGGGMGSAKSYIDSHGLRDFFLTQDWRAVLGDIPQRIVDTIIANNPKHVFLNDNGIVVLRDSTGGIESSNVVAAFLTRESPECDEVFGN